MTPELPADQPDCQRWMWIELIGFDNSRPDYNVPAFLDNAGFVPDGLSLLFSTPDFVHLHEGLEREFVFPPDYCSYAGKPYNVERDRQAWTNHQLKGLVDELGRYGVPVYFTLFNLFVSEIDGELYRSPWCDAHPELMEFTRDGQSAQCLNPLKRFPDGGYYEDFLVSRLVAVAEDYGFAGVHAADGYSSPRLPIWMADYSDDMTEQFVSMMGVELPDGIAPVAPRGPVRSTARTPQGCEKPTEPGAGTEPSPGVIRARADFIWTNLRREWCEFYARRFERLYTKICSAVHRIGRQVTFNNAWTRDPFEAYDRYGIDYRRIARTGVDRFFLETVGAGVSIGAESGFRADLRHELNFMLAFTKACIPDMPLQCLNATGDTTENWDVLNHAPPVSEREILTLGHMFVQDERGFRHASDGPLVCLADGINRPQWQWLRENWVAGYERLPARVLGATVVWSSAALDGEIADYPARRVLSRQQIAGRLQKLGAPLQVVAEAGSVGATRGCLLVPRPELLPEDELRKVLEYPHGPVVMIGRQGVDLPGADLAFAEGFGPDQLACRVYHAGRELAAPDLQPTAQADLPEEIPNPPNYLHGLYYRPVSHGFLEACADLLTDLSEVPRVVGDEPDLRLLAFEAQDGSVRLLVGNEAHFYVVGRIDMLREVRKVSIRSHFPGRPIPYDGRVIEVRVPPRGMVALDVEAV